MTDSRNFLKDSDYPKDKVIYSHTGSMVVPANTYDGEPGVVFPHGLPFEILTTMIWSETADFAVAHQLYDEALMLSYWEITPTGQQYQCLSVDGNIAIFRINLNATDKTIYYRITGLQPTGVDDSLVASTADNGTNYIDSSDFNSMKLVKAGVLTTADPIHYHNLGYTPRAMTWDEDSSGAIYDDLMAQEISNDPTGSLGATSGTVIDDNSIYRLNPLSGIIHYRIYADE